MSSAVRSAFPPWPMFLWLTIQIQNVFGEVRETLAGIDRRFADVPVWAVSTLSGVRQWRGRTRCMLSLDLIDLGEYELVYLGPGVPACQTIRCTIPPYSRESPTRKATLTDRSFQPQSPIPTYNLKLWYWYGRCDASLFLVYVSRHLV